MAFALGLVFAAKTAAAAPPDAGDDAGADAGEDASTDAGTIDDAGGDGGTATIDAGSRSDAGSYPEADAGPPPDGRYNDMTIDNPDGCGCFVGSGPLESGFAPVASIAVLAFAARRRRQREKTKR
ncbi:MAG TPA: hypothetical protein VF407_02930 [Polyangiaceae bacterium]